MHFSYPLNIGRSIELNFVDTTQRRTPIRSRTSSRAASRCLLHVSSRSSVKRKNISEDYGQSLHQTLARQMSLIRQESRDFVTEEAIQMSQTKQKGYLKKLMKQRRENSQL